METMRMVRFMIFQFSTATDWHLMKASFESAVRLVRRSDLCCLERPRGTGNTVCICTLLMVRTKVVVLFCAIRDGINWMHYMGSTYLRPTH
jgi:hypothetical protein